MIGALVALVAALATRADAAVVVVYHAQPEATVEAAAARDATAGVAAAAGAAFVDLSPPPPATPAAPAHLARGIELFHALQLDEASAALEAALVEARATGAAGLTPEGLSDLFLHRAMVATQRGDAAAAWDELVRAATVGPTRLLDPARFPPKITAAFQRASTAVAGAPRGRLTVVAPPLCRVTVDGASPAGGRELPFGEHFVRVECPGERAAGGVALLARPEETVELPRAAPATPADASLVALARERGAARVLAVTVTASTRAPATVRLRLLDAASGASLAEALAAASDPVTVRSLSERLLSGRPPGVDLAPQRPPPAPRRWYQSPWLWGAIGAGVATAILLPLAIRDEASGFSVRPAGDLWR